jgi:hypothetical protein
VTLKKCILLLGLAFSPALLVPAFAQNLGEITGVISDATNALIAGATVTVSNPTTGFTRQAVTNAAGNFDFPGLQPGIYNIKAEAPGFGAETRTNVELQVQQVERIDFQLKVGTVSESVEVSAGAPLLNTESADVGTVVETKRIEDLPLNGRNFLQLVGLSPNVSTGYNGVGASTTGSSTTRQGGDRTTSTISVSGQRREYNYYTLDGMSNTDVYYNTYVFLPSIDALQEFKVQTGIYSAEFGRELGQINVTSKSGSNNYHGTLFGFLRNDVFDALPFAFTSSNPGHAPFREGNYGFTLGGPVQIPKLFNGKDRLFFMSNFEGLRELKLTETLYSVTQPNFRSGNFSQLLPGTVVTDPLNGGTPFPGNVIPQSRLSPISLALEAYEPLPNVAGAGLANNYLALQNNTINKDQFNQRIDFVQNQKSTWFGRYSWGDESGLSPAMYENGTDLTLTVMQALLGNTFAISPSWVNEARFGFNYFNNNNLHDLSNKQDITSQLGLQVGQFQPFDYGIPGIAITGLSEIGGPDEGPYVLKDRSFHWADTMSWIKGKHTVRFGIDLARYRFNVAGNYAARGADTFQNQATGYGFGDFLLGELEQTYKSFTEANAQFRQTSQGYFITDSWKALSNLTLEFGLRYEFNPPYSDKNDTFTNVELPHFAYSPAEGLVTPHPTLCRGTDTGDFYQGTILRFNPAVQIADNGCLGGGPLVESDHKNFAPRVGISWSPMSKLTVRAGAGTFYVQDIGSAVFDASRNMAGRDQTIANTTTHNLTWANPYDVSGSNACGVSAPLVCENNPGLLAVQYNRRTPYVNQYEFNIQRQLTNDVVLEIGYFGSSSHFLPRFHYINYPVPGTGSSTAREPYPELSPIQYTEGDVNANYNSLTGKLTKRLSKGLSILAAYTFSKSIDDGSAVRSATQESGLQIDNCVECERGLSVFNQTHRFTASILYALPFGKGQQFLDKGGITNAILGGWQITSIVTAASGFPDSITTGTNRSGTTATDRPNVVYGQSLVPSSQTTAEWFNIDAFSENGVGQYGNAGRDIMISPGIVDWDGSLMKNFNFTEQRYLQFRFEVFNLLNHPNFADPGLTLTSNQLTSTGLPVVGTGSFGQISATRAGIDMRELQFSLKFIF